jgi:prepilin-type N-terminal cleavage/methylation domain-containing protein
MRRHRGFSLLEIVVAAAVLSAGVGAALQIFSGGMNNIRRIDMAHRAMNHAENVMNEILSDQNILGPIAVSGELDADFSFDVAVDYWVPPQSGLQLDLVERRMELLSVVVDINFKHDRFGKKYRAVCLKAVSLQPQGGGPAPFDPIRQLFGGSGP